MILYIKMLTIFDVLDVYTVCDRLFDYLVYDDLKVFSTNVRLKRLLKLHADKIRKLKQEKAWALKHPLKDVQRQSEEICLEAVRKCGEQLKYVKKQTISVIEQALDTKIGSFAHVREQTDELCKMAIKKNGMCLMWVENKTYELCLLALQHCVRVLRYMRNANVSDAEYYKLCEIAIKEYPYDLLCADKSRLDETQIDNLYRLATGRSRKETEDRCRKYHIQIEYRKTEHAWLTDWEASKIALAACKGKKKCRYETMHMKDEFDFYENRANDIALFNEMWRASNMHPVVAN